MEEKNKDLLVVIKYCLDIFWYLNFLSIAELFRLVWMAYYYADRSIVHVMRAGVLVAVPDSPYFAIERIANFIIARLLFTIILYNLRKVFGTFYRNEPFQYKNIILLRRIALYVALFAPLYFFDTLIVSRIHYRKFSLVTLDWTMHIESYLGIATIVYIAAEILRYGLELKKENEEFI